MKARSGPAVLVIAFAVTVAICVPAYADQKGVNDCARTISVQNQKLIKLLTAFYAKCVKAAVDCNRRPVADRPACLMGLQAAGKICSPEKLNLDDPNSKDGQAVAKVMAAIAAKCDPAVVNDANKLTNDELLNADKTDPFRKVAFAATRSAMCGVITTYAQVAACIQFLAIKQAVMTAVWDLDPRAAAMLFDIIIGFNNPVPLGSHKVAATVDIEVDNDAGGFDVNGIPVQMQIDLGAANPAGAVLVSVPAASTVFPPQFNANNDGVTMCIKQIINGEGRLCCKAGGCGLGNKSFDVHQDHDSSGNNAGFVGNEVGPIDMDCDTRASNTVSTFPPFVTIPCLEAEARDGACNRGFIGEANTFAHHPRCTGGDRADRPCDPADAVNECPGGGGGVCKSQNDDGALNAPPCIGPIKIVNGAGAFNPGDMVIFMGLQYTLHDENDDARDFGGGCANIAGDDIPDGYGCDGIPCNDDDITPPENPIGFFLTTGMTESKVFDANMEKTIDGGTLQTGQLTGMVPMNACRNLALSCTTGYELNGVSIEIDNPRWGDGAIAVKHAWQ